MKTLTENLRKTALEAGADFFGVGDLVPAQSEILEQGGAEIAAFPRAVSMGIRLPETVVDLLFDAPGLEVWREYEGIYHQVNSQLDHMANEVAANLRQGGNSATPVSATRTISEDRLCGVFSNKMAARLSGLGWIGKSCLLINPEAGPRVRWVAVLTDAPLEPMGQPMEQQCGSCRRCVESCPSQAFTGFNFVEGEPREARFTARKCREYTNRMKEETGLHFLCGVCVSVGMPPREKKGKVEMRDKRMRKIIVIDEEKCDGCGQCAQACHEGAIEIIDGKARLVKESYCDGLGDCIGECPRGAISFEQREAEAYDEKAVKRHLEAISAKKGEVSGCPGAQSRVMEPGDSTVAATAPSRLHNWPTQLILVPVNAPWLRDADMVIASDCSPFAFGGFHERFLKGANKVLLNCCPKLDDAEYYIEKLTEMIDLNEPRSIHVIRMEVPCCGGLVRIVKSALVKSGKDIPVEVTTIPISA
ncbi:MAG: 4Fe-4S binding protein [Synergistota bacterium]|nr:4Fe-4S binding protein [Synergistota bacterium]